MIFPSSNLSGTVIEVRNLKTDKVLSCGGYYKVLVILKNVVDKGWGRSKKSFVRTTTPFSKIKIKKDDKIECYCFEDMGSEKINDEYLQGYEMNGNFKKVKR